MGSPLLRGLIPQDGVDTNPLVERFYGDWCSFREKPARREKQDEKALSRLPITDSFGFLKKEEASIFLLAIV